MATGCDMRDGTGTCLCRSPEPDCLWFYPDLIQQPNDGPMPDPAASGATEENMMLLWCSFADPDRPEGTQFLGAVVIEAPNVMAAAIMCHGLGINPGGEVLAQEIPEFMHPGDSWTNRLLNREECGRLDGEMAKIVRNHHKETRK